MVTDPRVLSNRMNMMNMVLRWRYVVLSMEQSRNNYVINVCFSYNTYLLMTFCLLLLRKINIAALWRTWHIIVSGQIVALLLSFCMTNWLRKINGDEADVTLVQTQNRKVSINNFSTFIFLSTCEIVQVIVLVPYYPAGAALPQRKPWPKSIISVFIQWRQTRWFRSCYCPSIMHLIILH